VEPVAFSDASIGEDIAWLHGLRGRLTALRVDPLVLEARLEADLLESRIEHDLLELEVIRPLERDPASCRERVAGAVQAVLEADQVSVCQRARRAASRLAEVPPALRAVRVLLRAPPHAFIETALLEWEAVRHSWRTVAGARTVECRDPETQAALAEADSAAVRALGQLIEHLRLRRAAPDPGPALGPAAIRLALVAEGESAAVESVIARATAELESEHAQMALLAERIRPGAGTTAIVDELRLLPAEAVPLVSGALTPIHAFLASRELLPVVFHDGARPSAAKRGNTTAALDAIPQGLTPLAAHLLARTRASGPERVRALADPGRATLARTLYWEQILLENGFGNGDPRTELEQRARRAGGWARAIAALSIHARNLSVADAERLLMERGLMTPTEAARQALRLAVDPTPGLAALGCWRIEELRTEVQARLGPRFRLRDFHEALFRQGDVPIVIAQRGVLRTFDKAHPGDGSGHQIPVEGGRELGLKSVAPWPRYHGRDRYLALPDELHGGFRHVAPRPATLGSIAPLCPDRDPAHDGRGRAVLEDPIGRFDPELQGHAQEGASQRRPARAPAPARRRLRA
jgi:hypothetical protein